MDTRSHHARHTRACIIMAFIEVNKRILDYAQYREDVQVFIALLFEDVVGYGKTIGLSRQSTVRKTYHEQAITFFHNHLDLEVTLAVKKKHRERFV